MITWSIKSIKLHVKQIETIQVIHIAQVPLQAIWLRHQRKKVYSSLDCAYVDDISGSNTKKWLLTVAAIVIGLHRRLIPFLDNYNTSSLTYRPCGKCLNQGKMLFNARFSIIDDEKTLQPCGNAFHSQHKVAIRTRSHTEQHCVISSWLMLSPPCGPSAANHKNYLLVELERHHRNCYSVVPNVLFIVEMTEILIMIDIVCEVGKSLETPRNVIL
jgi:hypothetical protein